MISIVSASEWDAIEREWGARVVYMHVTDPDEDMAAVGPLRGINTQEAGVAVCRERRYPIGAPPGHFYCGGPLAP